MAVHLSFLYFSWVTDPTVPEDDDKVDAHPVKSFFIYVIAVRLF